MKKTLLIGITSAAIALGGLGTAWAHYKGDREEHGKRHLDYIAEELELTAEQKAQIADAIKERHEGRKEGMDDRREFRHKLMNLNPDAEDYQQQLDELVKQAQQRSKQMVLDRAEQQRKFHAILTPEQRKEFVELKQNMRKKWHERDDDDDHGKHHRKHCDD